MVGHFAAAGNRGTEIRFIPGWNKGILFAAIVARMDRLAGLDLFVRVVETGSFSKAADDLRIAQSTATKAVAAIEERLGARLLHRSTRGITPTEVGALYYEKCKRVVHEMNSAENLAILLQSGVTGHLRISTSLAFGRRVMVPLVLQYMQAHPGVTVDLGFDDRYVNMVEQGADLAIRMGRLADSSLGARHLGINPWVLVGAPEYLAQHPAPTVPNELSHHACLIYSSVQGDARWTFAGPGGKDVAVAVAGPLRSNNLSSVLAAARAGLGLAMLPWYVARASVKQGTLIPVLREHVLPAQELHAVFPSPKLVPAKITTFIDYLQEQLAGEWWMRDY